MGYRQLFISHSMEKLQVNSKLGYSLTPLERRSLPVPGLFISIISALHCGGMGAWWQVVSVSDFQCDLKVHGPKTTLVPAVSCRGQGLFASPVLLGPSGRARDLY